MDNKKNKNNPEFRTEFLSWTPFRQSNFITLIFLSETTNTDAVEQVLSCLDDCPEPVVALFMNTIFTKFSVYQTPLLDYICDRDNSGHIRLLLAMHITLPHLLDEATIDCIVSLYMDPYDAIMEPVVEAFVNEHPELALPSLIQHALKPNTSIRSHQLLQLIGQTKITAILGDLAEFPQLVVDCIKQIPPHPRPPKTPET